MPRRRTVYRSAPAPTPKPVCEHNPATVAVAERLIESAVEIPPAVVAGWRKGLIAAAPPSPLRWVRLPALLKARVSVPSGAAGALIAPLGSDGAACQLLYLDSAYRKVGAPDKLSFGPVGGRGFPVGDGDVIRIVEGIADALALAAMTGDQVVAAVGSSGIGKLALSAVASGKDCLCVILTPDGGDPKAVEAANADALKVEAMIARLAAPAEVRVDASWSPDPAAVWEARQEAPETPQNGRAAGSGPYPPAKPRTPAERPLSAPEAVSEPALPNSLDEAVALHTAGEGPRPPSANEAAAWSRYWSRWYASYGGRLESPASRARALRGDSRLRQLRAGARASPV